MTKDEAVLYLQLGVTGVLTLALVGGFFMGLVATEVFVSITSGAIAFFFSDRKATKEIDAAVAALNSAKDVEVVDLPDKRRG